MKKTLLAALVLGASIFAANRAEAYVFPANTQCTVNPAQATCAVYNPYPEFIQCWGRVRAQTASGAMLWANANLAIAPGTYQYVYVYTNNPYNPIVNAWADVRCRVY